MGQNTKEISCADKIPVYGIGAKDLRSHDLRAIWGLSDPSRPVLDRPFHRSGLKLWAKRGRF